MRTPKAKGKAKAKTSRKRPTSPRKERRVAWKPKKQAPPRKQRAAKPRKPRVADQPTYEPPIDDFDLQSVIVNPTDARKPRSDLAKEIAAEAPDDIAEYIRTRKNGLGQEYDINPYALHLKSGWNKRNFDTDSRKEQIDSYARSIASVGVQVPLQAHIEGDKIFVDAGWNRLLATYRAIETYEAAVRGIPVRVGKQGEDERDRLLSQIVTNMGTPPTPYEQGLIYKELLNLGWTVDIIAAKVGRSQTNIKSLLDIQELPIEVQRMVDSGVVSAYFAMDRFRIYNFDQDRAVKSLHRAIDKARKSGAKRALPKYADDESDPPPNPEGRKRPRKASGPKAPEGNTEAEDSVIEIAGEVIETEAVEVSDTQPDVPADTFEDDTGASFLVQALRQCQVVERGGGFVTVRYDTHVWDTLRLIAHIEDSGEVEDPAGADLEAEPDAQV